MSTQLPQPYTVETKIVFGNSYQFKESLEVTMKMVQGDSYQLNIGSVTTSAVDMNTKLLEGKSTALKEPLLSPTLDFSITNGSQKITGSD